MFLIVDDNDIDFFIFEKILQHNNIDGEVFRAKTVHDAYKTLKDNDITHIFLDVNLCMESGLKLLEKINCDDYCIILLSTQVENISNENINFQFEKPIMIEDLNKIFD